MLRDTNHPAAVLPRRADPLYAVPTTWSKEGASQAVSSRGENQDAVEQDVLFEVNAHVHEAARRFEGVEPGADRWDFTCECGASDCRMTVSLTLAEYEALRTTSGRILAPGHTARA